MQPMMLSGNLRWDSIFVYCKPSNDSPFTEFKSFNPILEGFPIFFMSTPLRRSNVVAPSFWKEVYFLPARFFLRRWKRKRSRELYQENRVDVPDSLKNDVMT